MTSLWARWRLVKSLVTGHFIFSVWYVIKSGCELSKLSSLGAWYASKTPCCDKAKQHKATVIAKCQHYSDVIMSAMASHITGVSMVYSTICSCADQRKHQIPASRAFVRGIHHGRWIPRTKGSEAKNASIWWRHHDSNTVKFYCNHIDDGSLHISGYTFNLTRRSSQHSRNVYQRDWMCFLDFLTSYWVTKMQSGLDINMSFNDHFAVERVASLLWLSAVGE